MWAARRTTDKSLAQIGAFFDGRDHTTVIHAVRKVERRRAADPAYRKSTDAVLASCRRAGI
jgi:chromosomal replication initiator protein